MLNTIRGTYGSNATPCNIFTYETQRGTWYTVEGSTNVNFTFDSLHSGVDVETVEDIDCFTWNEAIDSEQELLEAVEA